MNGTKLIHYLGIHQCKNRYETKSRAMLNTACFIFYINNMCTKIKKSENAQPNVLDIHKYNRGIGLQLVIT